MKGLDLDSREWQAIFAAVAGACLGGILSVLFFLFRSW